MCKLTFGVGIEPGQPVQLADSDWKVPLRKPLQAVGKTYNTRVSSP